MANNSTIQIDPRNVETKTGLVKASVNLPPVESVVSKFRDARLSVGYATSDTILPPVFGAPLLDQVSRISLIVSSPVALSVPDLFLKIIDGVGTKQLEILIVTSAESSPTSDERQKVGELLNPIRDRQSVLYRWSAEQILTPGSETMPTLTLLLQEAAPEGQKIILSVNRNDEQTIKAKWSWGDPLQRAEALANKYSSEWQKAASQLFTPEWDALGIDTAEYSLPKLYKHQVAALQAWEQNQFRGIFEMCTGAGKTVAALAGSLLLQQRLSKETQQLSAVVILCPKKVLVDQWVNQLIAKGFHVAAVVCDSPEKYRNQLDTALRGNKPRYIVSTYDSFVLPLFQALLKSAAALGRCGLLIADEMHWSASVERRDCLRGCEAYFPWRLGLSATPEIENDEIATRQLGEYFGGILKEARYGLEEALTDKVLCPYVYFPVPVFLDAKTSAKYFEILRQTSENKGKADLSAYSERRKILRKGEMQIAALHKICDEITDRGEAFDHTLVFCPPGDDYDDLVEEGDELTPLINKIKLIFQEREVLCTSILAETKERDEVLKEFERGDVSILLARHDIWGCGTVSAMTIVREKSELADCLTQIKTVLEHVTALTAIEVSTGGKDLGLSDHHKRILRIFSRLNGGVNVRVSPLGGGLSDARTLRVAVQDQYSNVTTNAVAKLGRISFIKDEEVRYNHCIAPSLGIGAFAHFIRFIRAGAADIGGIFYAFAQDYSRTLIDVLREDPAAAGKIVNELMRMETNWHANAVNKTMTVGEIRRTLIKDDAFQPVAGTLGFDWQRLEAMQVRVRWCCQHRDLHGLNVLLGNDGTPIFIDYGEVEAAPACLDPLIMELSLLFHPACKGVCGAWPTVAKASQWTAVDAFAQDTPLAPFITACRAWTFKVESQDNGVYATAYAYAVRQLKFPDTNHALAIAVAKAAANSILNS